MRAGTFHRLLAFTLLTVLAAGTLAVPASAQAGGATLTALGSTNFTVAAGSRVRLQVELFAGGAPVPGQLITWTIVNSSAGASGPSSSTTNSSGVASANFDIPSAGLTEIEALYSGASPVLFVITSAAGVPGPPPPAPMLVDFEPASPTELSLILGDRGETKVRVKTPNGTPVGGAEVEFAVVSSPGSPGVGRSDITTSSGADGIASGDFGFSTAGQTLIRATLTDPRYTTEAEPILFTIDTATLGELAPERRSYRSAAEALDQVCLDVFVDESGNQRPTPQPTPLCVYMTGTLQERGERGSAIRQLTATGIGAQSSTSFAGLTEQVGTVQSRLAALRGGALRGAVDRIALQIDGVTISNDVLAAASGRSAGPDVLERALENGLARLFAGHDAAQDPVASPADVAPRRERPWGFFVTGRLTRGDAPEGGEETGFDFDTVGVTAGIDHAVGANGFLGIALSSLSNETDLLNGAGSLDNDSLVVTLYAIREGERGYLQLTASAGQNEFDQVRRIDLPIVGALEARARFDGDQVGATLETGYSFDGAASSLTLFGRGSFARASVDGFRETGAVTTIPGAGGLGSVDFGLEVGEQEIDSLLGEAGLDWGRAFSTGSGLIIPQLTIAWAHEFDNDSQVVRARFLGDTSAGSSFFVFTDEPDRDWLTASAALRFQFLWGSLFVAYDREFQRDDLETETFNAGLRFEF